MEEAAGHVAKHEAEVAVKGLVECGYAVPAVLVLDRFDLTVEIWMGPQGTLRERDQRACRGPADCRSCACLAA